MTWLLLDITFYGRGVWIKLGEERLVFNAPKQYTKATLYNMYIGYDDVIIDTKQEI
jgi:hypothetical protein